MSIYHYSLHAEHTEMTLKDIPQREKIWKPDLIHTSTFVWASRIWCCMNVNYHLWNGNNNVSNLATHVEIPMKIH